MNDFVLVGTTANGIERRWLNLGLISAAFIGGAEDALKSMEGGAHGVVVHTKEADVESVLEWLEILMAHDGGAGTATLSEIIEGGRLPEEPIASEVLNQVYEIGGKGGGGGPPGPG